MLTKFNLPVIAPPPVPQTPRLLFISPAQIRRETSQVREQGAIYTGAEFEALVSSIQLLGIQQPLTVEELPATPGSYRLIAGHRRYEAAVHLGMAQLPCLVLPVPMRTQEQAQSSSTELAQTGRRVISQLAENMVRAEMDVIDKATGLKTAKVLADIGKVQEYLAQVGIESLPTTPDFEANLANSERLTIYEQHLAELSQILTSPPVAESIANPQIVYQIKNKPGEYAIADQALASWQTIEQACGVSKSQRTSLVRLLQLEPALIRLIRGHLAAGNGSATHTQSSDMLRSYLEALLAVLEPCREALLKTYLAYLNQPDTERAAIAIGEGNFANNSSSNSSSRQPVPKLEAKVIRLVAECLGLDELRREWQSVQGRVDYWRLVELTTRLAPQHFKAEVLASLYFSTLPVAEALATLAEGRLIVSPAKTESGLEPGMEPTPEPEPNDVPSLPPDPNLTSSSPPANSRVTQSGSGGGTGKRTNMGGGYNEDEGEAEGGASESGFGGGGYGGFADLDEAEGFELTGFASSELPPQLLAELEELNLSEAALKAIASLQDITLQRELIARVKEFPQIAGKLRRVVALVRDEGWALSEALDEALGWVDGKPVGSLANNPGAISTGTLNPDYDSAQAQAQIISGTQRLLDAVSSLEEGLELLQKASLSGKLADLPEPWAANALQILDQLKFTLSMLTGEAEAETGM